MAFAARDVSFRMAQIVVLLSCIVHIPLTGIVNRNRHKVIPSAIKGFDSLAVNHVTVQLPVLGDGKALQRSLSVPLEEMKSRISPGGIVVSDGQNFALLIENIGCSALKDLFFGGIVIFEYRLAYITFKSESFAAQVGRVRIERKDLRANAGQNK